MTKENLGQMYVYTSIEQAEKDIIINFDGCNENISDIRILLDELKNNSIGKYNDNLYVIDMYNILN